VTAETPSGQSCTSTTRPYIIIILQSFGIIILLQSISIIMSSPRTRTTSQKKKQDGLPQTVEELVKCLDLIPDPEGGYFRETFRSGTVPMTTRGCTNPAAPARDLVVHPAEDPHHHPSVVARNCLTSIYWVPTNDSPRLLLGRNRSDHVHYYQGGAPFEYLVYYCPPANDDGTLTRTILGPDIAHGHVLQLAVAGGSYKCGRILLDDEDAGGGSTSSRRPLPYSIIAEAVAPGFDVQDFEWVTTAQLITTGRADVVAAMTEYIHPQQTVVVADKATHFDQYYDTEK
jgi:uncharacterized protein